MCKVSWRTVRSWRYMNIKIFLPKLSSQFIHSSSSPFKFNKMFVQFVSHKRDGHMCIKNYTTMFYTHEFKITTVFEEYYSRIKESYFRTWVASILHQGKGKSIYMKFIWLKQKGGGKTKIWRVKQFSTPTYTLFTYTHTHTVTLIIFYYYLNSCKNSLLKQRPFFSKSYASRNNTWVVVILPSSLLYQSRESPQVLYLQYN